MGLDMYLEASRYEASPAGDDYKATMKRWLTKKRRSFPYISDAAGIYGVTHSTTVAYWRKANAIHLWFVNHVQGGVDECEKFYVSTETLQKLVDDCERVLATVVKGEPVTQRYSFGEGTYEEYPNLTLDTDLATELLPPAGGFFFGSTDMDTWYVTDLESTVKQLKAVIAAYTGWEWSLSYQSSW